jgi:hemimethylated DNA binding protein
MYFINDEEIYNKDETKPAKDKPWFYVLINKTNAISYIAQENLVPAGEFVEIEHPLVDFFFKDFDDEKYIRNDKTWDELNGS